LKLILTIALSFSAAGYCFAKASKVVAFAIGASILGLAVGFIFDYLLFLEN
jgi:uncharacterized membrane protein (Fun14 family)